MNGWSEVLTAKQRLARRRGAPSRRRRGKGREEAPGMYLASLRRTVPADPDLLSPGMRVAVVEDLWWSIEALEWADRKPPVWRRRARAHWRAEGNVLADKQRRIGELAGR